MPLCCARTALPSTPNVSLFLVLQLKANPIIALDFDGSTVGHGDFPEVGPDIGSAPWIKAWVSAGAKIILWTVRAEEHLKPAVKWFEDHDITLYGVNENPDQAGWSKSPKAHANLFVDELAFGAPLITPKSGRPYLDWDKVGPAILAELMKDGPGNPK